jgi:hypothetical protein
LEHREEARARVEGEGGEGGRGARVEGTQEEARADRIFRGHTNLKRMKVSNGIFLISMDLRGKPKI